MNRFPRYTGNPGNLDILKIREIIEKQLQKLYQGKLNGEFKNLVVAAAMELRVEDIERLLLVDDKLFEQEDISLWKDERREKERQLWTEVLDKLKSL
jgi:hypothetical protein